MSWRVRVMNVALAMSTGTALVAVAIAASPDPASAWLRTHVEGALNAYLHDATERARQDGLTTFDTVVIGAGVHLGIGAFWLMNADAAWVLWHALHGEGEPLELSCTTLRHSPHVARSVATRGTGVHGPIAFRQHEDWQLSLVFNPYYLRVSDDTVRLYHPNLAFAPADGPPVHTVVRVGELNLVVYDNLVSALGATPFEAGCSWPR